MRIRIKLVLAITGMVSAVVVLLSTLYLAQLLSERVQQSYRHNDIAAHQVLLAVRAAIERGLSHVALPANDPDALDNALVQALHNDVALQLTLNSFIRYAPTIYDINIANSRGRVLLSTDPTYQGHMLPLEPSFTSLQKETAWQKFRIIFGPPAVYAVEARLDRNRTP
ncbi:MAG: PAS domain-containing sensor histidine kinase, partial [Acidobacteriaceae bacterium]